MTGQIQIVKEGAAWKMGKESWSNKSRPPRARRP